MVATLMLDKRIRSSKACQVLFLLRYLRQGSRDRWLHTRVEIIPVVEISLCRSILVGRGGCGNGPLDGACVRARKAVCLRNRSAIDRRIICMRRRAGDDAAAQQLRRKIEVVRSARVVMDFAAPNVTAAGIRAAYTRWRSLSIK